MKHGITIREKKTHKLVKFVECEISQALKILGGTRINLDSKNYEANEEYVSEKEIAGVEA